MDYPTEIVWPSNVAPPSNIRLSVAAKLIALGLGRWDGKDYPEQETNPFVSHHVPVPDSPDSVLYIEPHEYLDIEPKGLVAIATEAIQRALSKSVVDGSIRPTVLKCSFDGMPVSRETWIETDSVVTWCDQRDLNLSDEFFDYVEQENKVFEAAIRGAENARRRLEYAADYHRAERHEEPTSYRDEYIRLVVSRQRASNERDSTEPPERPLLTRERNVLLAIIATLCNSCDIDFYKASKAASVIASAANERGIAVSESAIEAHLKRVPEAIAARKR